MSFNAGVFGTCRAGHSRSGQVVHFIIEPRQISMFSPAYRVQKYFSVLFLVQMLVGTSVFDAVSTILNV